MHVVSRARAAGGAAVALIVLVFAMATSAPASAAPRGKAKGTSKKAAELVAAGEVEAALVEINQGLASAPRDLPLLLLKGQALLLLRDYEGALGAYKAFLAAGATGGNRREVLKIVANLEVVSTTSLEVEAKPGPAQIYLDSRTLDLLCEAAPTCTRPILPGRYKVIVERPGYLRASQQLKIEAGTRASVVLTMTEKPSSLTVTTSVPAEVSIDGQPAGSSPVTRELPAGDHQIEVISPGHGSEKRTVALHQGEPATLDVTLCELVGLAVTPADATVEVDGAPARREADGKLCVSPGEHTVTAKAVAFHDGSASIATRAEGPAADIALTLAPVGALLSVKGAPRGALLSIDGKVHGPLPLAAPLELPPGEHQFEITRAGMLPFRGRASLRGNEPALVALTRVRTPGKRKAWIMAGASAAATVTGVVLGVMALSKASDHDDRAKMGGVTVDDPELDDLKSSSQSYALAGDIAFIAAALSAGVSTYFFLREGRGLSEGKIQVGVGGVAGANGSSFGLSAARRF